MKKNIDEKLRVSYAQAVHDEKETQKVVKVLDEHRTILGKEVSEFEERVATEFGKEYGIMVNSGSSANLLAIELLNLPEGSEVITPLLTFSTTVTPLLQKGLIPVFIDVEPGTYISRLDQIEKLITKKTKALMIPLLLGNVPDMQKIKQLAEKYNLFIIEDSCDTLGARFDNKPTGTFSDISTTSFYGSHIITAGGGGGMLLVNRADWRDRAKVLRGWGRSSSVLKDHEKIEDRFNVKIDNITYDANFIFDEVGYNFLPMEIGAAFGNAQLDKLPKFRKIRQANFDNLHTYFQQYEEFFILPKQNEKVDTQWLAFPLTIKKTAPFTRLQIATYLEKSNIQTRTIFTGNILRQPAFKNIPHRALPEGYPATDEIMERGFLIGCHHGMEEKHLQKIKDVITTFITATV
jgi:CDP-6-deoxy-D-xylo-4-hexulose-3-dehydrase